MNCTLPKVSPLVWFKPLGAHWDGEDRVKQQQEEKVLRDNRENANKEKNKTSVVWMIKVRSVKLKKKKKNRIIQYPWTEATFKQIAGETLFICFVSWLDWDFVTVLKKPVKLYVLKHLPRDIFEVWQWKTRFEGTGLRLKTHKFFRWHYSAPSLSWSFSNIFFDKTRFANFKVISTNCTIFYESCFADMEGRQRTGWDWGGWLAKATHEKEEAVNHNGSH